MTFEFLSMDQSPYVIWNIAPYHTFLKFDLLWYGIDFVVYIMYWSKDNPQEFMQMNLDALYF